MKPGAAGKAMPIQVNTRTVIPASNPNCKSMERNRTHKVASATAQITEVSAKIAKSLLRLVTACMPL
jgi:hypothetical protein